MPTVLKLVGIFNLKSMLTNKNIQLRALEPEDLELLYLWENNSSLWLLSNTTVPISKHQLVQFIQDASLSIFDTKQLRLMIENRETKEAIGCIDLFDFDAQNKKAGIGILINDSNFRNRGFGSQALATMINYAFEFLQLHQLYCNILTDNEASIKVFTQMGFQIVGKKLDWILDGKKWKDEYILQLINPNQKST
jgi:diamine N-acetyltransferase